MASNQVEVSHDFEVISRSPEYAAAMGQFLTEAFRTEDFHYLMAIKNKEKISVVYDKHFGITKDGAEPDEVLNIQAANLSEIRTKHAVEANTDSERIGLGSPIYRDAKKRFENNISDFYASSHYKALLENPKFKNFLKTEYSKILAEIAMEANQKKLAAAAKTAQMSLASGVGASLTQATTLAHKPLTFAASSKPNVQKVDNENAKKLLREAQLKKIGESSPMEYLKILAEETQQKNIRELVNNTSSGRLFAPPTYLALPKGNMGENAKRIANIGIIDIFPVTADHVKMICETFNELDKDLTNSPEWGKYWEEQRKLLKEQPDKNSIVFKDGVALDNEIKRLQVNVLSSYHYKVCMEAVPPNQTAKHELLQTINTQQKELLLASTIFKPDDKPLVYPSTDPIFTKVFQKSEDKVKSILKEPRDLKDKKANILKGPGKIIGEAKALRMLMDSVMEKLQADENIFIAAKNKTLSQREHNTWGGLTSDDARQVMNVEFMNTAINKLKNNHGQKFPGEVAQEYRILILDYVAKQKKAGGLMGTIGKSGPAMAEALQSLEVILPSTGKTKEAVDQAIKEITKEGKKVVAEIERKAEVKAPSPLVQNGNDDETRSRIKRH